jgi:catechol 2,3-dioxygenase
MQTRIDPSDQPTEASCTPLRMSHYTLAVRDLGLQVAFYERAVGLQVLERGRDFAVLGNAGVTLLRLEQSPGLRPDDIKDAGLHHLAFLLPTRAGLADWYRHAREIGLPLTRTGDHHVNEALYFDDAEGNGCECYADRPASHWIWDAERKVYITTDPVDLDSLRSDETPATGAWTAPRGMRIGHINLRVGELDAADRFYCDLLGLDHTCRRPIMTFMANGGYHHHMAANILTSAGAGRREEGRAGLVWFAFEHDGRFDAAAARERIAGAGFPVRDVDRGFESCDPWGIKVRLVRV